MVCLSVEMQDKVKELMQMIRESEEPQQTAMLIALNLLVKFSDSMYDAIGATRILEEHLMHPENWGTE